MGYSIRAPIGVIPQAECKNHDNSDLPLGLHLQSVDSHCWHQQDYEVCNCVEDSIGGEYGRQLYAMPGDRVVEDLRSGCTFEHFGKRCSTIEDHEGCDQNENRDFEGAAFSRRESTAIEPENGYFRQADYDRVFYSCHVEPLDASVR